MHRRFLPGKTIFKKRPRSRNGLGTIGGENGAVIRSEGTKGTLRSRVILFVLLAAVPLVLLAGSATTGYALDEVVVDVVGLFFHCV